MTWFVHRRKDGTVASAHREMQPGYAEEPMADDAPEILAMLAPATPVGRVQAFLDANPVVRALVEDIAATRGQTKADVVARIAGKL